ncbi:MAG: hypothetical protein UY82_C0038G0011 [Candidatus Uhrbacteria bacterium GW2011_GWC2_53_7]|uniref:Uncharacterized protein n=1 Tax=Candidatus Uhrbacteria bacterium GW2011_GWC2_53_7 TaxID=1618986 RepID=A0A0G1XW78_9BACT|nr:MAG: hypothetical protein UY82_C0038G0011 [Candidatus Uhrbacteria bacterium GW2011_GWC2_53_7]
MDEVAQSIPHVMGMMMVYGEVSFGHKHAHSPCIRPDPPDVSTWRSGDFILDALRIHASPRTFGERRTSVARLDVSLPNDLRQRSHRGKCGHARKNTPEEKTNRSPDRRNSSRALRTSHHQKRPRLQRDQKLGSLRSHSIETPAKSYQTKKPP